jgi:phosphoserine phosphatase RsbU/P
MVTAIEPLLREQLLDRRHKLEEARNGSVEESEIKRLLNEVDEALHRMELGTYGICEVCDEPIQTERLLTNPLTRLCIGDLSGPEKEALEDDLELAAQIQNNLLPRPALSVDGWEVAFHYEPAGLVSGDYCDLITGSDSSLHFVLADVSGKGVAASMLMAHLQAMFRTLVSIDMPLDQMLARASRVFCESTMPNHYATLVCGKLSQHGLVELSNAGHLPPLLVRNGEVWNIEATGLPVGLFNTERFSSEQLRLEKGDTLFLYTDGLSESVDANGKEYGVSRLSDVLARNHALPPRELIGSCISELNAFRSFGLPADDLTMMAIQRVQ